MAWDEPDCIGFFTVDIYTCKPFSNEVAVEFTRDYWNTFDDAWDPVLPKLALDCPDSESPFVASPSEGSDSLCVLDFLRLAVSSYLEDAENSEIGLRVRDYRARGGVP
jgi:hypothetical protein